jgi:hypothetical protein
LARVQHRLILFAIASSVKVIVVADLRVAKVADLQQLPHALVQLPAARQLVENAARVRQLYGNPMLRLGSAAVFQPTVRIDDLLPEVIVGDGLLLSRGRLRDIHRGGVAALRSCGRNQQERRVQRDDRIAKYVV